MEVHRGELNEAFDRLKVDRAIGNLPHQGGDLIMPAEENGLF